MPAVLGSTARLMITTFNFDSKANLRAGPSRVTQPWRTGCALQKRNATLVTNLGVNSQASARMSRRTPPVPLDTSCTSFFHT